MKFVSGLFKTIGPRVIGVGVTAVAGWIYARTKGAVVVDVQGTVQLIVGGIATYALTHRATSAVVNPGDAAKSRLAEAEKRASDVGSQVLVDRPK